MTPTPTQARLHQEHLARQARFVAAGAKAALKGCGLGMAPKPKPVPRLTVPPRNDVRPSQPKVTAVNKPWPAPTATPLTTADVIAFVSRKYLITKMDLKSKTQKQRIARPRQIAMYLCRELIGKSYPLLGREFGRDHSTVIVGCRNIKELMIARSDFAKEIETLKMELYSLSTNKR